MVDENRFPQFSNVSSISIFIQRWSLVSPLIHSNQIEMLALTYTYACPARFSHNYSNNMTNSCFKIHFSKVKSFCLSDIQLFTWCPWECWKKSVYYQEIIMLIYLVYLHNLILNTHIHTQREEEKNSFSSFFSKTELILSENVYRLTGLKDNLIKNSMLGIVFVTLICLKTEI